MIPNNWRHINLILFGSVLLLSCWSVFISYIPISPQIDFLSSIKTKIKVINPIAYDSLGVTVDSTSEYNEIKSTTPHASLSSDNSGLHHFYDAIDSLSRDKDFKIHIGYFGDSMIEGDLITQDLRTMLQGIYGGSGVGFMPITSVVSKFRNSIRHEYSNSWGEYNFNEKVTDKYEIGPTGHVFITNPGAWVEYRTLNTAVKNAYLFIKPISDIMFTAKTEKYETEYHLKPNGEVQVLSLPMEDCKQVRLIFNSGEAHVQGISFDGGHGIYVDNFSFRGTSGTTLSRCSSSVLRKIDSCLNYQLIILQYGVNVLAHNSDYTWYKRGMSNSIQHIKAAFPNASLLIIGTGDRAFYEDGHWQTEQDIYKLLQVQYDLAKENNAAFFNLFESMGGENTMVSWVNDSIPKLGANDYIHLSPYGAKLVANLLYNYIQMNYKKRILLP